MTLVEVGLCAAWYGPIQVLLALQAAAIAPDKRELVLSLVFGTGAIVSLVSHPFFGALSDHTTSRYGRRVPWILGGTIAAVFGMVFLATSWTVATMIASWAVVNLALNASFAAITAIPNDRVLEKHRGEMAGWIIAGKNLGTLLGAGAAVLCGGIVAGYIACIGLLCLSVIPYLWHAHDRFVPPSSEPYRMKNFFFRFYISPRKYPDFAWAWLTKFLVMVPFNVVVLYMLYYLADVIHHANPKQGLLVISGLCVVLIIIASMLAGMISDYKARRKPFVLIAGFMMAVGCVTGALTHTWIGVLVATCFIGLGYGMFLPTHFAVTTMVLPSTEETARDLGILYTATNLPQLVAPLVAVPFLALIHSYERGYTVIYLICAAWFLLGSLSILKVKSVK